MPDSFQPPIGDNPHDPFEKYRVSEIQKDKNPSEPSIEKKEDQSKTKSMFAAYVALLFKKFLDLFEETTERGLAVSEESDVLEHLNELKSAIEILKTGDRGQDSAFLNGFSRLWHQILEDALRFRRQTPLSAKMRLFIKDIQHFPENQMHSLGYYLTEYAGQKWLPFPYMEMISRLSAQHQKKPESSLLARWSGMLEEMIRLLKLPEKHENK